MDRRFIGRALILLSCTVLQAGCWGQKFFSMPRETIETSAKVDSLLRENALLQRRVYHLEKTAGDQGEYGRSANAQLKLDIEELKDQLNALQQMLRELGASAPIPSSGGAVSDSGMPGQGTVRDDEEAFRAASTDTASADMPAPSVPADTVSGGAVPADSIAIPSQAVPAAHEMYRQVYLDFNRREYQLALEESEVFLREHGDSELGEEVRFIRGECYIELNQHFEALREFSSILQLFPKGKQVPASLFRMAVSYEEIGERELAAGIVRRLLREYPYSEEAGAAEEQFKDLLQD